MAANVPVFTLANGVAKGSVVKMPSIGIGYVLRISGSHTLRVGMGPTLSCRCWMGIPGGAERVEVMVKLALKVCLVVFVGCRVMYLMDCIALSDDRMVIDTLTRYVHQVLFGWSLTLRSIGVRLRYVFDLPAQVF